jgi:hypothetical protein
VKTRRQKEKEHKMKFQMTPDDFLKGGLAEIGWHPAQIVKWDDTSKTAGPTSKNPGSQLINVEFKMTAGPNKGKPAYTNFSEVAPGFMIPLLEALGATFDKKSTVTVEVTKASMEGKFVDIHLVPGSFNGKPNRTIDAYRKYTGPQATATQEAGD